MSVNIFKETEVRVPRKKVEFLFNKMLTKKDTLSVVFINSKRSKELNKYRGKNKPTNVLTFELDKHNSEIYIDVDYVKKETDDVTNRILYLIIHGILHIKGYKHGDEMEALEEKYMNLL